MAKKQDWRKIEMGRLEVEQAVLMDLVLQGRGIEPSGEAYTALIGEVRDLAVVADAQRVLRRAEEELEAAQKRLQENDRLENATLEHGDTAMLRMDDLAHTVLVRYECELKGDRARVVVISDRKNRTIDVGTILEVDARDLKLHVKNERVAVA